MATGATRAEAEEQMHEAIEFHIEELREDGLPVPPYADNLAQDTGPERVLLDRVRLPFENLGQVSLEPEKPEDPRHLRELDQNILAASLGLFVMNRMADGPGAIGL